MSDDKPWPVHADSELQSVTAGMQAECELIRLRRAVDFGLGVAKVLRAARRQGESEDKPEGARYIVLSDTLANQLADMLERS